MKKRLFITLIAFLMVLMLAACGSSSGTGEQEGDDTEYEYYEYSYPDFESSGDNYSEVERFYLKEGNVFAVYTKITMGETETESAEIIKKMTGDIPEGTFDIPDLSDYEKIEY